MLEEKRGSFEGAIRIPLHASSFFFNDLVFLAIPRKSLKFLTPLFSKAHCPERLWIFTCNATDGLEPRFLSRTMQLQFSSHGIAEETSKLLERVWQSEAGDGQADTPNFLRIVRDSQNNVRDALQSLQVELLAR
jgi:hypothetical protein